MFIGQDDAYVMLGFNILEIVKNLGRVGHLEAHEMGMVFLTVDELHLSTSVLDAYFALNEFADVTGTVQH